MKAKGKTVSLKYVVFGILLFLLIGSIASCKLKKDYTGEKVQGVKSPRTVLRLPPNDDNPRNSEGDFIMLNNGKLLYVYTHYSEGSGTDHDPAHLASRYSLDGGITWSVEDEVIVPNEGQMNVMSVSLLRLQNGAIALFYLRKNSTLDCVPMMRLSMDEAQSWSDPIACITDKKGYFVLNNDRVIQLADGRLLLAVAEHPTTEEGFRAKGNLYSYYSDDNGKTWSSSTRVPNDSDIITQEPGVIEMEDGQIMMYIRASGGVQHLSYSQDSGESWSPLTPSSIYSPLSPATIEKIPGSNNWIMVWNNNDGSNPATKNKRTPLTMAISKDEGKTWTAIKNIEEDPNGWYCYTALYFVDPQNIIMAYCSGNRTSGNGLETSSITVLSREWAMTPLK
ncbi:exo-alpha-sialidase [Arenibacter aquaticus]|uniref:Exo-alpha-sialidase n=1 Tax=Arenibacter aquaticus TaxID=2489054 RepID=A0A3S0IMM5_9FLAO|nr:sialidase family protein [Arenibacter aquaticus]RTE53530.1 exo-alpha-sialidase [Arenibacter aquaticus]